MYADTGTRTALVPNRRLPRAPIVGNPRTARNSVRCWAQAAAVLTPADVCGLILTRVVHKSRRLALKVPTQGEDLHESDGAAGAVAQRGSRESLR
jgi:hypothetical protein